MTTEGQPPTQSSCLLVCLGNICRSPMAEAVLGHTARSRGYQLQLDSAGTGGYHEGDSPDPRTMRVLRDHGIDDYRHAARSVRPADFTEFEYILAMDNSNLQYLQRMKQRMFGKTSGAAESRVAQVMLFGDFGGEKGEQVGDPYYGAKDGFSIAYNQMERFSQGFVKKVLEGGDLS